MQSNYFNPTLLYYRGICTVNNLLCASFRNGRFMNKIMSENKSKKKNPHWYSLSQEGTPVTLASNLTKGASEGKQSGNHRRVTVLNKLFMRYITDLMACGTSSSEFIGKGIEISRVMVTPDFKGVNVFWLAKGITENDDVLQTTLTRNAGALRHELSQLRVMGVVPQIHFVKDKHHAKLMEVDARLAIADFGDDYEPTDTSYRLKSEFSLNSTLSTNVKEQIAALECKNNDDVDDDEEPLPPMRMDVFSLDHAYIMLKVQKNVKKSQTPLNRIQNDNNLLPNTINECPVEYKSQKQQKEAFKQFLVNRQILQLKAAKQNAKYDPSYEYLRSERIGYKYESTPFIEELNNDHDYIDEDNEDQKYKN